jgi:fructokinase
LEPRINPVEVVLLMGVYSNLMGVIGGKVRIGIDLGGTKIEVVALGDDGVPLVRHRVPTPAGNYLEILRTISELVDFAEKKSGQRATVGICTPGAISLRDGHIKNSNNTILNGKAFDVDIAATVGRPVRIENDANCFALSEAIDGAAAAAPVVFGLILGTGVGGGVVVDKKILRGRNRIAGEWGHNPLPWIADQERQEKPCYCGKFDCIETFLSGAGLSQEYRRCTGMELTAVEVAAAANAGDGRAVECLETYKHRLARALAGVINILDPDLIVLGGGLSNVPQLYQDLRTLVGQYVFSDSIDTPIVRAFHGDSGGVRGAAWLWPAAAN